MCNTKYDTYGGLWADEGVYRIAKEAQLVKPNESGNLFLAWSRRVSYGKDTVGLSWCIPRMFAILVKTECHGTDVIKSVISASHYSRARTAHSLIYEVLMCMMLEGFLNKFSEKRIELEILQFNFQFKEFSSEEWKSKKEQCSTIQAVFQTYVKKRASISQSFT